MMMFAVCLHVCVKGVLLGVTTPSVGVAYLFGALLLVI